MSVPIKSLIIDAFAKIERQDQRVVRIRANHRFANAIKQSFNREFDEITNEHLQRLVPSWLGSLFGAHIYIDNELEQVIFEGDHGATTKLTFETTKKEPVIKLQDTKRKFKFILEER